MPKEVIKEYIGAINAQLHTGWGSGWRTGTSSQWFVFIAECLQEQNGVLRPCGRSTPFCRKLSNVRYSFP